MNLPVLPQPQKYELKNGTFDLFNCSVCVTDGLDNRVIKAAVKLKNELYKKTGSFHKFTRITRPISSAINISKNSELSPEEYHLEITEDTIAIIGGDDVGCFYGIGTLFQLLDGTGNLSLPCLSIKDKPDMKHRGYYHDVTRGRVPTVDGIKSLIDILVKLKVNSLQLYVEHTFNFEEFKNSTMTCEDYLTAEEILEIDQYCYDNFIDFIPSLSTFGHLYELLMRKEYADLCELENFEPEFHFWRERMLHHTIDPTNQKSFEIVSSLIDQYLPLFRSNYFNICCDETFDLGKGRNSGKNSAELYIDFVSKIAKHITNAGKTVMMWADIALEHPELLPQIPDSTVLLNWWYDATPDLNRIKNVAKQNKAQIVCPGTNSWYALLEILSLSEPNINKMVKCGYENGAIGTLNTNWGDYGHAAHIECALYSTTLGACLPWNVETEQNSNFEEAVSKIIYGVDTNIIPLIRELGNIHLGATWVECFDWQKSRDSSFFKTDEAIIKSNIKRCGEICTELSKIPDCKGTIKPVIVAAEGILMLNQAAMQIKTEGSVNDQWREYANHWFEKYKDCWLKDNKYSELDEIKKFVENM